MIGRPALYYVPLFEVVHDALTGKLDVRADVLAEVLLHGGQQAVRPLHVRRHHGNLEIEDN